MRKLKYVEENKEPKETKEQGIEASMGFPTVPAVNIRTNGSVQNSRDERDDALQGGSVTRSTIEVMTQNLPPSRAEIAQKSYPPLASDDDESVLTRRMPQRFQNAALQSSFTVVNSQEMFQDSSKELRQQSPSKTAKGIRFLG